MILTVGPTNVSFSLFIDHIANRPITDDQMLRTPNKVSQTLDILRTLLSIFRNLSFVIHILNTITPSKPMNHSDRTPLQLERKPNQAKTEDISKHNITTVDFL